MADTYTERICQALERIATALEIINEYGVTISTLYEEPIECSCTVRKQATENKR